MTELSYSPADARDIPFICRTYNKNLSSLHGKPRTEEDWARLLALGNAQYFTVRQTEPVAWFRLEEEDGELWLGMLQVDPLYHRRGIGRYILTATENIARERSIPSVGIHTTEDNLPARALYSSAGYSVTRIGPCTTADGKERTGYTFKKTLSK